VAIARRLLGMMVALLKTGKPYDPVWPARNGTARNWASGDEPDGQGPRPGRSEREGVSPVPAAR
jgi:hypothetical protein